MKIEKDTKVKAVKYERISAREAIDIFRRLTELEKKVDKLEKTKANKVKYLK